MSATTQLKAMLAEHDIDLGEILDFVKPGDSDSAIMFVGSFNEGFGNSESDVDILIIHPADRYVEGLSDVRGGKTARVGRAATPGIALRERDALVVFHVMKNLRRLQLTVTTTGIVEHLQNAARGFLGVVRSRIDGRPPDAIRKGMDLDIGEHKLLHRVYSGTVLYNDDQAKLIRSKFAFEDYVQYCAVKKTSELMPLIEDYIGILKEYPKGEDETKLLMAQHIVMKLGAMVLTRVGEVNPGEKFLFRLLKRHQDSLGSDFVSRLITTYTRLYPDVIEQPRTLFALIDDTFDHVGAALPIVREDLKARKQVRLGDGSKWEKANIFAAAPQVGSESGELS